MIEEWSDEFFDAVVADVLRRLSNQEYKSAPVASYSIARTAIGEIKIGYDQYGPFRVNPLMREYEPFDLLGFVTAKFDKKDAMAKQAYGGALC